MRYDSNGRELYTGEYERPDGKYEYKYIDENGKRRSITAYGLGTIRERKKTIGCCATADDMSKPSVEVKDKILLDIDEAVALFGLPRGHLYELAQQHKELVYTTGRNIHFKRVPLEQYIMSAVS